LIEWPRWLYIYIYIYEVMRYCHIFLSPIYLIFFALPSLFLAASLSVTPQLQIGHLWEIPTSFSRVQGTEMNYSSPNTSFTALPLLTTDNETHPTPKGQENVLYFAAIGDAISNQAADVYMVWQRQRVLVLSPNFISYNHHVQCIY